MADEYVKGVPIENFKYDFAEWGWGDYGREALKKINEDTAALVASQIFDSMTLNIETSGDRMGQAIVSFDAIYDAFFAFDLAEAVAGAVEGIEDNYTAMEKGNQEAEIRDDLLALRAKLSALVDIVDASPALKEPSNGD
jgi:hypothetical protein